MGKSYKEFKNMVLNNGYDLDGAYGAQCWDGYAKYAKYLGQTVCRCSLTGYVGDIYTLRNSNGILNYNSLQYVLKKGDIVTFQKSYYTPYTHIAIYDGDCENGYGYFLGQNQGGKAYPGGGAKFNIVKLPYSITDYYAFRPNALNEQNESGLNEYGCDDILHVGSHVSSKPMKIGNQGLKNIGGDTCCYLEELGGWYPISQVSEFDASDGNKDNYLANTNAVVYLDKKIVTDLDVAKNRVKLNNGIWVNATPLIEVVNA